MGRVPRACLATASAATVASSEARSISATSSASRFRSIMPPMRPLPGEPLPGEPLPGEASPAPCSMLLADLPREARPLATPPKKPPDASDSTPAASDGAPAISGDVGVWAGAGAGATAAAVVAAAVATVAVGGVEGRLMVRWTVPAVSLIMVEASR